MRNSGKPREESNASNNRDEMILLFLLEVWVTGTSPLYSNLIVINDILRRGPKIYVVVFPECAISQPACRLSERRYDGSG